MSDEWMECGEDMKKKIIVFGVLGVVLLVLCFVFYYADTHDQSGTLVTTTATPEEILKEMPDIEFSEEEMRMKEILEEEAVIRLFSQVEAGDDKYIEVSEEETVRLLHNRIPQGYQLNDLAVGEKNTVYITLGLEDKQLIYYTFSPDYDTKSIGVFKKGLGGRRIVKFIYQNKNGELAKLKEKRKWFTR